MTSKKLRPSMLVFFLLALYFVYADGDDGAAIDPFAYRAAKLTSRP